MALTDEGGAPDGTEDLAVLHPIALVHGEIELTGEGIDTATTHGGGKQTGDNVKIRNYGVYNAQGDTGMSGVTDIMFNEDVEPIYFNLQGVRVEAPLTPGIYIVKKGNKVSKTIIR